MQLLALDIAAPNHREFTLFQKLIEREAGIHLVPAKRDMLAARLRRRLRELGLGSFGAYYDRVASDPAERTRMLDRVSTNETRFFRESQQLAYLTRTVLPQRRVEAGAHGRPRRLRAWSAACSTGEEPYTLAMILLAQLPPEEGWQLEILASDLSTRALDVAREGQYRLERAHEIPDPYLKAYMLRGVRSQDGWMSVGAAARALVRFEHLNLCTHLYPPGVFDLVLCRNVLIYFGAATRERVLAGLAARVAPGGHLLVGHAESLSGTRHGLRWVGPLTYQRPQGGGS